MKKKLVIYFAVVEQKCSKKRNVVKCLIDDVETKVCCCLKARARIVCENSTFSY